MAERRVLSRQTRGVKAVGGRENKTTAASTLQIPFGKLPAFGNTGHTVTRRNRCMVITPGLYEEKAEPSQSTAFILNTAFSEPFMNKYSFQANKDELSTKRNAVNPFMSFGKARTKFADYYHPLHKQLVVSCRWIKCKLIFLNTR